MDEDVYFVDDERNAVSVRPAVWGRPTPRPAMTRVPPRQFAPAPRPFPQPYYPPQPPRPVVIMQRSPSLFAGLDLGELLERGVNLLAAMQSLPNAPNVTGEPAKDVGNMIVYQEALGGHAKADERLRAFGGLASQVVKVLLKNSQQRANPLGGFGSFGG